MTDADPRPTEHGVDAACYANGPAGLCPYFCCMCGWNTKDRFPHTWEEAGELFDEHLRPAHD